jgi:hypothetical protein
MLKPTDLTLVMGGGERKESRGDEMLVEHRTHVYMRRGQLEFATGWSADSVNYWQNRLASEKLLKIWPRPTARDQLETSLTHAGESYLESLGYENRGYAESLMKSKKPQRKHWLQVTSNSLGFLRAGENEGREVEVLPPMTFATRDGRERRCDKLWMLDGLPLIVEVERSKKDQKALEEIFQIYGDCWRDELFELYGLEGPVAVLYITPTGGKLPKLREAAKKAESNGLFYFTHEGLFRDDCTKLLTDDIWSLCTEEDKEMSLYELLRRIADGRRTGEEVSL